ncbi:MAG: sensor histidine kinase, partial [Thermocrispum sp.]
MRRKGRKGDAVRRAPEPARAGRVRLGKKIEQLRRTPSGTPLRLRNWSLRTKLIAVLLIPTLTALVLIGLHFNTQLRSANRLAELSARVTTDGALSSLVHALQRERDLTVHYVANGRKSVDDPEFVDQRARVDARLAAFSKTYSRTRLEMSDAAVQDFKDVRSRLEGLPRLRYGAEHDKFPANKVLDSYGDLISALLTARGRTVSGITQPDLVRLQLAGIAVARIKEQMSITRGLVDEAMVVGRLSVDRRRELAGAESDGEALRSDFDTFATAEQERMYDDTVTGMLVDQRNDMLDTVVARSANGKSLTGLDRAQWDTAATFTANLVFRVEQALQAQMQTRTDALAAQARTSALRDGAIVLLLLLLAGLMAIVIGRSLIRPLRTLRSTALEVAEYRLPAAVHGLLANPKGPRKTDVAPVPVSSTEEVGQVARAFDAVHGEAVRLAAEQAELRQNVNTMFLNLARRGQELADRQLDVLDRMEADEQDPDVLAKLFELDHLATRSRRVSENLLVLTGNDFARMLPGSVAASEVIAAALSEIEHYQRVQLSTIPEISVRGDAVSDVVHVISELLENATNESGADGPVSVVSSINREGAWLVEITDSGEGMSDEEMDTANARLADPPEIDVEASRRMGLYVVARLARRNGVEVRLRQAHTGGITASVLVP